MKTLLAALSLALVASCASVKNNQETLWVGGFKTEAAAEAGKAMTLQVVKGETLDQTKWQNFYAPINGFNFEEGYLQKIVVKETHLDPAQVPADASSIQYDLVKVLKKEKDIRTDLNGSWSLVQLNQGPINRMVPLPVITIDLSKMLFSAFGGCNQFSGGFKTLTDTQLELGQLAGTMKACMNKNIEPEFIKALAEVKTYDFKNGKLVFYNGSGESVLAFIKKQ